MGSHTSTDPPRMRSLEWSSQQTQNTNRDIFLDLTAEFTSTPNASLPVLDVSGVFDIDIQHQLIFQIESANNGPVEYGNANEQCSDNNLGCEDGASSVSDEEDERVESSRKTQEETPRTLYTRGMGLSPSPTRRLFPPSSSSGGSQGERLLRDHDDGDKENKEPERTGSVGNPSPRRDTTVIHLPSSPMEARGRTRERLADDHNNPTIPLSLPLSSSAQLPEGESRNHPGIQAPSRIPVKAAKSLQFSDISASNAINSLLLSRAGKRISLSPSKTRNRPKLWTMEGSKKDSESRHFRRKTYPHWRPMDTEEETERVPLATNTSQQETQASLVHDWLQNNDQPEEFDEDSKVLSQGASDIASPSQIGEYATQHEYEDAEFPQNEAHDGLVLNQYQPWLEDEIVLPSPSPSSQLSMPWNSAEELASPAKATHFPATSGQPSKRTPLPALDHHLGTVFLAFPEDVMEGVFVCNATLHLHIVSPHLVQGERINISCSTAEFEKSFGFKWAVHYAPTQAYGPVPRVFFTSPVTFLQPQDHHSDVQSSDNDVVENGFRNAVVEVTKVSSDCGQDDSEIVGINLHECGNRVDWERLTRYTAAVLTWARIQIEVLHSFLVIPLQDQAGRLGDSLRELGTRHRPALIGCALLTAVFGAVLVASNGVCQLESSLYYHPDEISHSLFCSMWMRGGDTIRQTLNGGQRQGATFSGGLSSESLPSPYTYCWIENDTMECKTTVGGVELSEVIQSQRDGENRCSDIENEWPGERFVDGDSAELQAMVETESPFSTSVGTTELPVSQSEVEKDTVDTLLGRNDEAECSNETDEEWDSEEGSVKDSFSLRDKVDWLLGWKRPVE